MRIVYALVLIVVPALAAGAQQLKDQASLRGLSAIRVQVNLQTDNCTQVTESELQTAVELRLRMSAVRVAGESDTLPLHSAFLRVNVVCMQILSKSNNSLGYTFALNSDVVQWIYTALQKSPGLIGATWATPINLSATGKDEIRQALRDAVDEQASEFLNAYLAANPKG